MKNRTFKLAIVFGALALSACTAGETSDKNERLSAIFGDNQQSLDADGNADCDAIHSVLLQNGIDPELLDPEVVREACIDSPDGDRSTCDVVAYSCFGPQDDCTDPPPPVDACDELWRYIDPTERVHGLDTDGDGNVDSSPDRDETMPPVYDLDHLVEACDAGQYPDDICALVYECAGTNPDPDPDPDICAQIRQHSPDGTEGDEQFAWELCFDLGYSDAECAEIIQMCFDPTDPGDPVDPNPTDEQCEVVKDLADQGLSEEEIYHMCVDRGFDPNTCQTALWQCLGGDPADPNDPGEPDPDNQCAEALGELQQLGYEGSADGDFNAEECAQATGHADLCEAVSQQCF